VLYILVGMSELTAVGKYVQYWWPQIPAWASAAVFFVMINVINLANVKVFGEAEFWFAIIKVVAILGMIALGSYMLVSGSWRAWSVGEQSVGTRRLLPQRGERAGDGAGVHHVLLRRPGDARFHRRRSRSAESHHSRKPSTR
jgi:L-asparagine transporter-like permease